MSSLAEDIAVIEVKGRPLEELEADIERLVAQGYTVRFDGDVEIGVRLLWSPSDQCLFRGNKH